MDVMEHQLLARQLAALGVDLPAEAKRALAVFAAAMAAAEASPAEDLRLAFEAGKITPQNAGRMVQEAARNENARTAALGLARDLDRPVSRAATRALAEDGDRIVTELRPAFAAAAETVRRAAETFAPDADPATVLASAPDAAALWQQLAAAAQTLDAICGVRIGLAGCGYGNASPVVAAFVTAVADTAALRKAEALHGNSPGVGGMWHALIAGGFELRLNTAAEAAAVIAKATAADASSRRAEEARTAAANQERAKAWQLIPR